MLKPISFIISTIIFVLLVSGCDSKSTEQFWGSPGFGITLEKPRNWKIDSYERNGSVWLSAEKGILAKESAYIKIWVGGVSPNPPNEINSAMDQLSFDFEMMHLYYDIDLEDILVLQEPTELKNETYDIAVSTIQIPTLSMPENSLVNQIGIQAPDVFQIVELRAIRCSSTSASVYAFKSSNEKLNDEATDIVESIDLICTEEELE